jgi:hypothetical protein
MHRVFLPEIPCETAFPLDIDVTLPCDRSPNLLLDMTSEHERPRYHVKIADFGLARLVVQISSVPIMEPPCDCDRPHSYLAGFVLPSPG